MQCTAGVEISECGLLTDQYAGLDQPHGRFEVRAEGQVMSKGQLVVLQALGPRGAHEALGVDERALLQGSLGSQG